MGEAFADRWAREWAACGGEGIGTEFVPCGAAALPDAAAPFNSFDRAARAAPVRQVFGPPAAWSPADRDRLAAYRVIGSDGAGNPVCVEDGAGAVVLLDHGDRFRKTQFVNSSVSQLAACLLAFVGERDAERFRSAVEGVDPAAFAEGSFWWRAAAGLGAGE